jgi:hypothetical protein
MGLIIDSKGGMVLDDVSEQVVRSLAMAKLCVEHPEEFKCYYQYHYELVLKTEQAKLKGEFHG